MQQAPGATARHDTLHLPLPRLVERCFGGPFGPLTVLTDDALLDAVGTRVAFTGRSGGTSQGAYGLLNLGDMVGDDPSCVEANRRALLEALGLGSSYERLVNPLQVHGTHVVHADGAACSQQAARQGADAVTCDVSGVPVLLCFADCVPLCMVAPDGSFAVAHAGWRGAVDSMPRLALEELAAIAGCSPAECNIYIGPHIAACCYEVSDELLQRFTERFGAACANGGNLDLDAAVLASLEEGGAQRPRIANAGICTSCASEEYYSYRASGGTCGRHGALAAKK